MHIWTVLLASGRGSRIQGQSEKKQFLQWRKRPLYWHSVLTFCAVPRVQGLVITFPAQDLEQRRAEVPAADAAAWLDALVGVYREAQRRPLPFLPSLGVDYQVDQDPAASRRPKDAAAALRSRNGYLSNTWRPAWEWRADPYFRLAAPPPAYLGEDPATSDFCRIAEAVCGPLVAHLRAEEAA